jgi:hypothetical protein
VCGFFRFGGGQTSLCDGSDPRCFPWPEGHGYRQGSLRDYAAVPRVAVQHAAMHERRWQERL